MVSLVERLAIGFHRFPVALPTKNFMIMNITDIPSLQQVAGVCLATWRLWDIHSVENTPAPAG